MLVFSFFDDDIFVISYPNQDRIRQQSSYLYRQQEQRTNISSVTNVNPYCIRGFVVRLCVGYLFILQQIFQYLIYSRRFGGIFQCLTVINVRKRTKFEIPYPTRVRNGKNTKFKSVRCLYYIMSNSHNRDRLIKDVTLASSTSSAPRNTPAVRSFTFLSLKKRYLTTTSPSIQLGRNGDGYHQ